MNGRQEPVETLKEMVVKQDDPSKVVKIGSNLSWSLRDKLIECLRSHVDVFAWSHEYMLGIDTRIAGHK